MAARAWWRTPISKARTRRSIRTSSRTSDGIKRLFRQFSWPYGIPSHVAPETPGSIHEGGELGYSLVHAYGAAFDNPDLIVACVVGDGEAETGPLATSWHSNKFLNPATDGAVLPILHLNGYKIANPTVLARIPHAELEDLMRGYGYEPFTLEGDDPTDDAPEGGRSLRHDLRSHRGDPESSAQRRRRPTERPAWPMLIMRTPKGWTGPKIVDGKPVENTWRAHQVPFSELREKPDHLRLLEEWMRSYKPEELFDEKGRIPRRVCRHRAQGPAAHGHECARQWRPAAASRCACRTSATSR